MQQAAEDLRSADDGNRHTSVGNPPSWSSLFSRTGAYLPTRTVPVALATMDYSNQNGKAFTVCIVDGMVAAGGKGVLDRFFWSRSENGRQFHRSFGNYTKEGDMIGVDTVVGCGRLGSSDNGNRSIDKSTGAKKNSGKSTLLQPATRPSSEPRLLVKKSSRGKRERNPRGE
eukprot:scaffold8693_cov135-Amphora_coffeaeformis.AAC.1